MNGISSSFICKKSKYGYFINKDGERVDFRTLDVRHLKGTRYKGIFKWLFWWVRIPRYQLLEDLTYVDPNGRIWTVPKGFIFNGGSIPFFMWWLCDPDQPNCFPAFCLHDWLCIPFVVAGKKDHLCDSKETHWKLYTASIANGYQRPRAIGNYLAVRVFGPRFKSKTVNDK